MKINPVIFKAYDIRGLYPEEINEETAYLVGRAFVEFLNKKNLKIVTGRDNRPSSPALFKALVRGLIEGGADVINIGLSSTPMFYFAISYFKCDGGITITASHNSNPWNGFKLVREKAIPLAAETGIFWLKDFLAKERFFRLAKNRGKIIKRSIGKIYLDFNLKLARVKRGEFKGLSLAIDAGNGAGGPIALKLLKETGIKVYPIFCRPDGSFPNHPPDPLIKENLKFIVSLIKKKKEIFGAAFDGDGDRIIFIDERGEVISGDLITALMAKIILKNNSKSKILYDVRSGRIVKETIKKEGGIPISSQIGHALIKEEMRKKDILFGGELSGHYYLGRKLFYEVPFFVLLNILKEIKKRNASLSYLVEDYKKYFHSGEINFKVANKEEKIKELKTRFKGGKISELDGLRVDFRDWWLLVRPSNTEPVLRLVIEAKTKELLAEKKKVLTDIILH